MSPATEQGWIQSRARAERDERAECQPTLREALERERAFRIEQLAELAKGTRCRSAAAGSRPGATEAVLRDVDAAIMAGARQALADLERALAAMRAGQYGQCEDCGGEIPLAVLRAVPRARLCLDCHLAHVGDQPVPTRDDPSADPESPDGARAATWGPVPPSPSREFDGCFSTGSFDDNDVDRRPVQTPPTIWLRRLLGRAIRGPDQRHLGHVSDVVVHRTPDPVTTAVSGVVADFGGHLVLAPAAAVRDLQGAHVTLSALPDRRAWCAGSGEHFLARDVLGRPVMTATTRRPSRISDIALRRTAAGWVVWAADTRSFVQRLLRSPRQLADWDGLVNCRFASAPWRHFSR